jgi:DNA polymerase IV
LFGRSSAPHPAVLEREALDREPLSLPPSSSHGKDPLDEAIQEIQGIGAANTFIEELNSGPSSDNEDSTATRVDIPGWQKNFQCMYAHDGTEGENNPNSKTIEILGKMQAYYERTMDQWRAISYRKVISVLKKTKEYIGTEEQARR